MLPQFSLVVWGQAARLGGTKNFNTRTQPCNSHVVSDPDQIFSQRISLTNEHTSTPHIFKTKRKQNIYILTGRHAKLILPSMEKSLGTDP